MQATARPNATLDWWWSGSVTAHSALVKVRVSGPGNVRLVLSTQPDFSNPGYSAIYPAEADMDYVIAFPLEGLAAATQYYYALEIDGIRVSNPIGRLRTFGEGAWSFDMVVSADAYTGSNKPVFDEIAALDADLYLVTGDLHYADVDENDVNEYRDAFADVLRSPRQAALYRKTPVAYVWDDHDFAANDCDSTNPGRPAARQVYQEIIPHYPLSAGSGDVPIYQAFTMGRVRFIMTDLRSERSPDSQVDNDSKTMLGEAQKAWFKNELLAANGVYPVIVWVSSVPWIHSKSTGGDDWGGFSTERAELAAFIEANAIQGLVMIAGDAHMLALDDGSHNTYGPSGKAMFPVMQVAPLNQESSSKGGPYTFGPYLPDTPEDGQFALIRFNDDGDRICMDFSGRVLLSGATSTTELISYHRCFPPMETEEIGFQDGVAPDVTYVGTRDTTLEQNDPTTNLGAETICLADGDNPTGSHMALLSLLRWDLAGWLPAKAVVQSAQLVLNVTNATHGSYALYGLQRDWSESEANWNVFRLGMPWQIPGADGALDRGTTLLGTLGPVDVGTYEINLNTAGVTLAQTWVDQPNLNYGLLLVSGGSSDGVDFTCREADQPTLRPRLNLEYREPQDVIYIPVVWK